MKNQTRTTSTILNQPKVSVGETWDSITTIWDDETRTWDEISKLITNIPKTSSTLINQSKPYNIYKELVDSSLYQYKLYDDAENTTVVATKGVNGVASRNTDLLSSTGYIQNSFDFNGTDDYVAIDDDSYSLSQFSVNAKTTTPLGLFFKPDGTKMYICSETLGNIHEYNLETAWEVTTAVFSQSLDISAKETNCREVFFNPDGTKMYILGLAGRDITYYNLGTAWDISSASYVSEFSLAAQTVGPTAMFISPDGLNMYICSYIEPDTIFQYVLGTAWDMSTASYASKSLDIDSLLDTPSGIYITDDGVSVFISAFNSDTITRLTLSTPWDISTGTAYTGFYLGRVSYVSNIDTGLAGIKFNSDGLKCYFVGYTNDYINQFELESAYSFAIPTYKNGFSISAWIKPDSVGETTGRILDKTISTNAVYGFDFYLTTTNRLGFSFYDSTANSATGSVVFGDTNWYHVVATVSSDSKVNFYVNGVLSGTANQQLSYSTSSIAITAPLTIGNRAGATDRSFDGKICNLDVFNRPLLAKEVMQLYLSSPYWDKINS